MGIWLRVWGSSGVETNLKEVDTYGTPSLHGSSFLGLPFRILNIELKPKKRVTCLSE